MKNFITVTVLNKKEPNEINININSISNFYDKMICDNTKKVTAIVYKNTGLINTELYFKETAETIKKLIIKAQK